MKKLLLSLLTFLFLASAATAQEFCATQYPKEMEEWLDHYIQNKHQYTRKTEGILYVPVQFHIVGETDGSGYFPEVKVIENLCLHNQQFEKTGMQFYLYDDFNYINNSNYYRHDYSSGAQMMNQYNVDGVYNVYVVQDPAGACGYYTGWGDAVALAKSCFDIGNGTWAHESGHYFSLPHTFYGWESGTPSNPELVNGSNCSNSADKFCDTPADYISNRWNCPTGSTIYAGTITDNNGDTLQIDGSLFMSYSNDACMDKFSNEQTGAMEANLLYQRDDHLNHPEPEIASLSPTNTLYPEEGAIDVPSNYALLKWNSVKNAKAYIVAVTQYQGSSNYQFQTITTDTSVVVSNLYNYRNYYWKVKPFTYANACTDFANGQFKTGAQAPFTADFDVTPATCYGDYNGSAIATPNGGISPYIYAWSNGEAGNTISNVQAGVYTVTITDSAGSEATIPVDIPQATPIQADFDYNYSEGSLTVIASGGNGLYTYAWSNGATLPKLYSVQPGQSYTVTITDAEGCKKDAIYVVSGLSDKPQWINAISIRPNPAQNGQQIELSVESAESANAKYEIYSVTGQLLATEEVRISKGENSYSVKVDSYNAGIYFLKLKLNDAVVNRKFVLTK